MATQLTMTLGKRLRLPWTNNSTGAHFVQSESFTAVVCPILQASHDMPWFTRVTINDKNGCRLSAEYGGALTEIGKRLAECFLFDTAIGIPRAQKELRQLCKAKRPVKSKRTSKAKR